MVGIILWTPGYFTMFVKYVLKSYSWTPDFSKICFNKIKNPRFSSFLYRHWNCQVLNDILTWPYSPISTTADPQTLHTNKIIIFYSNQVHVTNHWVIGQKSIVPCILTRQKEEKFSEEECNTPKLLLLKDKCLLLHFCDWSMNTALQLSSLGLACFCPLGMETQGCQRPTLLDGVRV